MLRPREHWWQFWRPASNATRTLFQRYPDPDKDGEGSWRWSRPEQPWASGNWLWLPDALLPEERCESELCLFGREWIHCKKRKGHTGIHRNCETWAWDEGDERV